MQHFTTFITAILGYLMENSKYIFRNKIQIEYKKYDNLIDIAK